MQDHGIGDVCDVKLVKTHQTIPLGHAPPQFVERIHRSLQVGQFPVHFPHELMKVQSCLAHNGHSREKTVHQEALATANPTVHVHATRDRWASDQLLEGIGPLFLVRSPFTRTAIQRFHSPQLGRIAGVAPRGELGLIDLANGLHAVRVRSSACACRLPVPLPWSPRKVTDGHDRCGQCLRHWP